MLEKICNVLTIVTPPYFDQSPPIHPLTVCVEGIPALWPQLMWNPNICKYKSTDLSPYLSFVVVTCHHQDALLCVWQEADQLIPYCCCLHDLNNDNCYSPLSLGGKQHWLLQPQEYWWTPRDHQRFSVTCASKKPMHHTSLGINEVTDIAITQVLGHCVL